MLRCKEKTYLALMQFLNKVFSGEIQMQNKWIKKTNKL